MLKLNYRDTMACVDSVGRIRCPSCGRFTKLDSVRPGIVVSFRGGIVHYLPTCARCNPPTETPVPTERTRP